MYIETNLKTLLTKIWSESSISIYLFAFLIPFYQSALSLAIVLLILEQLIKSRPLKKNIFKGNHLFKNPLLWLFLFYAMHLVGMSYTQNMSFAKLDIGMKMSFAILPILFFIYDFKIDWKLFARVFIIGAFVSIGANLLLSFMDYMQDGRIRHFAESELSHFMHRSYWAVYLIIAYYFLLKMLIQAKDMRTSLYSVVASIVLIVFIVLSGAKVGFALLLIVSVWGGITLFRKMKNKWIPIGVISVFIVGVFLSFYIYPKAFDRVVVAYDDVTMPIEEYDKEKPNSTSARVMLWDSSMEIIKENFLLGVGTGDIKDVLIQRNYDKGYTGVAEKQYNCHNQFFNTHIALGLFGTICLLMIFITHFIRYPLQSKESWKIMVVVILFLALIPESMLETQAGIIPYAFLLSALSVKGINLGFYRLPDIE